MSGVSPPTMVGVFDQRKLVVLVGTEAGPMSGARAGPGDTWDPDQPLLPEHHMRWLPTAAGGEAM